MRVGAAVLGGLLIASSLLVASGCTDRREADHRLPDSSFLRPVPSDVIHAASTRETSRQSLKLAETTVPTAMSISALRLIPATNAAVFSTHRNEGDFTTSELYLRIFGDDGYSIYRLTSGFDQWDVREASPARIVVTLLGDGSSDDSGKVRTLIVTFGSDLGHSGHGFYPTPEAVTVSLGG